MQGGMCLPLLALELLLAALQAGLICTCRLMITMLVPPLYGAGVQVPLELVRPASSVPHCVLRGCPVLSREFIHKLSSRLLLVGTPSAALSWLPSIVIPDLQARP